MNADDLTKILDELGRRLGPAGEQAFALAVRYQVTNAAVGIVFAGVLLVCVIAAWRIGLRKYHTITNGSDKEFFAMMGGLIGGTVSILLVFLALYLLFTDIITLLNPEYAAIRDILPALNGARR